MSKCIYCGMELPEGYGIICKECETFLSNLSKKIVKGICVSCQKMVAVTEKQEIVYNEFARGWQKRSAHCVLCGDEVWFEEIENGNLARELAAKEGSQFFDRIGGWHSEGEGWDPNGEYCGECGKECCAECYHWLQGKEAWTLELDKEQDNENLGR